MAALAGETTAEDTEIGGYAGHALKKRLAHMAVKRAIYNGFLVRKPCEVCGAVRNDDGTVIHAHHDDYDRALEVRWLCKNHHQQWHRDNGRDYYEDDERKNTVIIDNLPETVFCPVIAVGPQVRAARGLLNWTQRDLAERACVALGTLRRMETADVPADTRLDSLMRVISALEGGGVVFLNDSGPGVRLRKK